MAKSKIEWCEHTWNPLRAQLIDGKPNVSKAGHAGTACTKVSPGCNFCYASTINRRFYGNEYSYHSKPGGFFLDANILRQPVLRKQPTVYFVGSMTDIFHEGVSPDLHLQLFNAMSMCPQHLFLILTKRPARMRQVLCGHLDGYQSLGLAASWKAQPLPNVWLLTSVENQEMADQRIPILLSIPAARRGVSCEPLLGPVDLWKSQCIGVSQRQREHGTSFPDASRLDWVIVGGESGPNARPMSPLWARMLRDQCGKAGVPFFFKQWGAYFPHEWVSDDPDPLGRTAFAYPDGHVTAHWTPGPHNIGAIRLLRVGKRSAGRLLDGVEHNERPEWGNQGEIATSKTPRNDGGADA